IGAREYDPTTGQFLSTDPLLTLDQHQSLNGYAYANNNPVTNSDSTGTTLDGGGDCGILGTCNVGEKPGDIRNNPDGHLRKHHGTSSGNGNSGTAPTSSTGHTSNAWGKFTNWVSNTKDTVVNYGSAIVSQPDIWIGGAETVGSMILMGQGADVTTTGVTICLSGVGCLAGAPIAAGGVVLVGIGAYGAKDGIGRINDGLGKALREAESTGSGETAGSASGAPSWIPKTATSKVPDAFGSGKATKKGIGWRWNDGKGNGIRIDQGNLNNSQKYQQVDHVVINSGGRILGRDGKPIEGDIKTNAYEAHIPLTDWLKWKSWNSPN
ncbi:RHS repeat-associated core domain-containing protein, partial [Streptomyces sp. NPDC047028]|uniref:RHS repeat-associated core domain-containing protein n=1 Tax=Streptomyces sp. NPDC047028 TaxID=3155793 RepID=UPI0033D425D4